MALVSFALRFDFLDLFLEDDDDDVEDDLLRLLLLEVVAAVPIMLLIALLLARIPAYMLHKKHRRKQRAVMIKLISALSLILYPGLCTRLFSSLKTVNIVGVEDSVLAVDGKKKFTTSNAID